MNIVAIDRFGAYTTEDGWFWETFFTINGLIFLGILALLIWGLYSYIKNRGDDERADRRFERDIYSIKNDREYIQAEMRDREFEENADTPIIDENDR